jgi:hypothetical protein
MQCKDIPETPILAFLADHRGEWCHWFDPDRFDRSVRRAMPPGTPEKLALAKMRGLIRRGLVEGCDCGCRGDFEITEKGMDRLATAPPA